MGEFSSAQLRRSVRAFSCEQQLGYSNGYSPEPIGLRFRVE